MKGIKIEARNCGEALGLIADNGGAMISSGLRAINFQNTTND